RGRASRAVARGARRGRRDARRAESNPRDARGPVRPPRLRNGRRRASRHRDAGAASGAWPGECRMNAARSVAIAVFKESVRDRIFYNLVLFAVLLVGASILMGQLTAGQDVKIIKDLGLTATSVFGLFISIFVGINLVSKEVERRSVYPLFAKPIRRSEFIIGKYAGLLLTLMVNVVVMTVALYTVLFFL